MRRRWKSESEAISLSSSWVAEVAEVGGTGGVPELFGEGDGHREKVGVGLEGGAGNRG